MLLNAYRYATGITPVSFPAGTLSGSGAPTTVTGASRAATVPAGNSGEVLVQNFMMTGTVTLQANVASGGFNTLIAGDGVLLANTNTLQFRITGAASGEALSFNLVDTTTGALIETVTLVSV